MSFLLWVRAAVYAAFAIYLALVASISYAANAGCVNQVSTRVDQCNGCVVAGKFGFTFESTSGVNGPNLESVGIAHRYFANNYQSSTAKCTNVNVTHVLVTKGDHDLLIDSAQVVTKLQDGFDLATVGLAMLCLLAGLIAGHKIVQRRDSQ